METIRLLVRYDCADGCGPHPRCLVCRSLTCVHVLAFICDTPNLDADIQALPAQGCV